MTPRFGTDGLRGLANVVLTPEIAVTLGRAAARVLGDSGQGWPSPGAGFVVGRDTRRSGPLLEAALCAGLAAEGAEVLRTGVAPTPAVAYLAQLRACPGAVVSASHNPFEDNGIKLFAAGGRKLLEVEESRIEAALAQLGESSGSGAAFPGPLPPSGADVGTIEDLPGWVESYVDHLVGALDGRRLDGLSVVLDCANGAAFETAPLALRRLGARVVLRSAAPDGRNINDRCGSTHLEALSRAVPKVAASAGLALDGDGDRVLAIDETGGVVDGDHLLAMAAIDLAARHLLPGRAMAATVMSNLGLRRAMEAHGIGIVETAVGDRAVTEAMEANGLALGGEQSGHLVFAGRSTTGDGALTSILVLDLLARSGRPLSELATVVRKLPQVLRTVPVGSSRLAGAGESFDEETAWAEKVLGDRGRVLVRASGTEAVVRVMVEAEAEELARRVAQELVERLSERFPGASEMTG